MDILKKSIQDMLNAIQQLQGADQYLVMAFVKNVLGEAEHFIVSEELDFSVGDLLARCSEPFSNARQVECVKAKDFINVTIMQDNGSEDIYVLKKKKSSDLKQETKDNCVIPAEDLDNVEVNIKEELQSQDLSETLDDGTSDDMHSFTVYEEAEEGEDEGSDTEDMHLEEEPQHELEADEDEGYSQVITIDNQGNPMMLEQEVHVEGEQTYTTYKPVVLRRPRSKRSAITEESLVCKDCGRKFPHISNLRVHMRRHTGELPFACTYCKKRFTTKQNCQRHESTMHLGIKAFTCQTCDKSFTEKKSLNIHVRTKHNGERPFKCDICMKSFTQRSPLVTHMLRHSTGPAFDCWQCGLSFLQKGRYIQHLNKCQHKKDIPLKKKDLPPKMQEEPLKKQDLPSKKKQLLCHICSSSFSAKEDFRDHLLQHKEAISVVFVCSICKITFPSEEAMNVHLQSIHQESELVTSKFKIECTSNIPEDYAVELNAESPEEDGKEEQANNSLTKNSSVGSSILNPDTMANIQKIKSSVVEETSLVPTIASARKSSRTVKPTLKASSIQEAHGGDDEEDV